MIESVWECLFVCWIWESTYRHGESGLLRPVVVLYFATFVSYDEALRYSLGDRDTLVVFMSGMNKYVVGLRVLLESAHTLRYVLSFYSQQLIAQIYTIPAAPPPPSTHTVKYVVTTENRKSHFEIRTKLEVFQLILQEKS